MTEDPILLSMAAVFLFIIPFLSSLIGKKNPDRFFTLPIVCLSVGFIIFFYLIITQEAAIFGRWLFYLSMSLWTGGFFGIFFSWYQYSKYKKNKYKTRKRDN